MTPDLPLRDVHAAVPADWWPVAPGWWVLALVVVGLLAYGAFRLVRAWRKRRLRQALYSELETAEAQLHGDRPVAFLATMSELLKRLVIHGSGRRDLASVHSSEWESALAAVAPDDPDIAVAARALAYQQYQPPEKVDPVPPEAVRKLVTQWIERVVREAAV